MRNRKGVRKIPADIRREGSPSHFAAPASPPSLSPLQQKREPTLRDRQRGRAGGPRHRGGGAPARFYSEGDSFYAYGVCVGGWPRGEV